MIMAMVRTKHAFLFVVSFFVLALVILSHFASPNEYVASQSNVENLIVTETPEFTVHEQAPKDTVAIRESFLAKMRSREQSASVLESAKEAPEEPVVEPEVTEEPASHEEAFDWSAWMARIPEFEEKQIQYSVNVEIVKNSVTQIILKKDAVSASLGGATASMTPETLALLTQQKACYEGLEKEGEQLIAILEGSDAAPLGLVYTVLMKDIRAQYAEDKVEELYAQSLETEARNNALIKDYVAKGATCDSGDN